MTQPDNPGEKPDAAAAVKTPVEEAAKEVENEEEAEKREGNKEDKEWDNLFGVLAGMATSLTEARLFEMEQAREMRRMLFILVGRGYAKFASRLVLAMVVTLVFVMYAPLHFWDWLFGGDCSSGNDCKPLLIAMGLNGKEGTVWPLTAFIVGTFATFVAFSTTLFRAISTKRDKKDDDGEGATNINIVRDTVSTASNAAGGQPGT